MKFATKVLKDSFLSSLLLIPSSSCLKDGFFTSVVQCVYACASGGGRLEDNTRSRVPLNKNKQYARLQCLCVIFNLQLVYLVTNLWLLFISLLQFLWNS